MDNLSIGSREIYGILSGSRLLTGFCGLLTLFKWTMTIPRECTTAAKHPGLTALNGS